MISYVYIPWFPYTIIRLYCWYLNIPLFPDTPTPVIKDGWKIHHSCWFSIDTSSPLALQENMSQPCLIARGYQYPVWAAKSLYHSVLVQNGIPLGVWTSKKYQVRLLWIPWWTNLYPYGIVIIPLIKWSSHQSSFRGKIWGSSKSWDHPGSSYSHHSIRINHQPTWIITFFFCVIPIFCGVVL